MVLPSIAADNMADLEQLRRITPFMCNVKFGNSLPEVRQQCCSLAPCPALCPMQLSSVAGAVPQLSAYLCPP